MKFSYFPDTDSLYIALSDKKSFDTQEVAPNVLLDLDENGNLVGIDIYQYASKTIDLKSVEFNSLFEHAVAA